MKIKAPCKINVSLSITGVDSRGYHLLEMVNVPLSLSDEIDIKVGAGSFYCSDTSIECGEGNLCRKAVKLMKEEFGIKEEFDISLIKNIPSQAGLGGGSSDAAAIMAAVNELTGSNIKAGDLAKASAKLGADVPFFFDPSPSFVSGIGENIEPFAIEKPFYVLLVKPKQGLNTKQVYSLCDSYKRKSINSRQVIESLKGHDFNGVSASSGNDLLEAAISLCPDVGKILGLLKEEGLKAIGMTGSGSCCYALSDDLALLKKAANKLEKVFDFVKITCSLN